MTKFEQLLKHITHKHVYIQTHNFPDPDAIASAYGLQKLLEFKGIHSTLCYSGKIDRHNTVRMMISLNVQIHNIDALTGVNKDAEIILVDSQKGNSNLINMTGDEIICIDHHPISTQSEAAVETYRFCDIRPKTGACASIIAEYFFENNIPMDSITATLLCYGIRMDTLGLSRSVTALDIDMFYKMFPIAKHDIIRSLECNTLQLDDLKVYASAINSIEVYDKISFANTGYNCPEALIASISDFMLQLQEVDFSIVYSFKDDGVKLSIRSEVPKYDAGSIAEKALHEIGSGGGHACMAGGFIPYAKLNGFGKNDETKIISIIQNKFLNVMASELNIV